MAEEQSALITKFHNVAFSEKKKYLQFIYEIGRNGLVSLFKFPGEKFSLWWFSLVAEKAPLKSDSYERLISELLHLQNNPSPGKMALLKETPQFHFLHGLYAMYRFILNVIYAKTIIRDFKGRHKKLVNSDYTVVSYFPLMNKEKAENGIFENKYIAPFHRLLEEKHQGKYVHLCLSVDIDGLGFKDSVNLVNKFSQNQTLFLLEEFIKIRHVFFVQFYYVYFSLLFIFNINRIKKNMLYAYEGKNYNVWHILKNDFYLSFCGHKLASSLWYIFAFKEVTASLKKNSKVVSICEMQGWERAFYIFAQKNDLITIGYQHTIVPELILNYFNHPDEIGKGQDGYIEKCPLPDYLATVGNISAELFKKYGWHDERVFVWGSQRFESFKEPNKLIVPWQDKENYLVCAFSISTSDSIRILSLLERAFKETTVNYKIYLKSHPSLNIPKLVEQLGLKLNREIFEYTDTPLEEIMRRAKGIIVTESSSSFYAMVYGSPVIVPRFEDKIDCNPLSYVSDIPIYVSSDEGLRNICEQITKLAGSPLDSKVGEFLNNYFYFPTDTSEYLDKIDSLTHLKN